MRAALALRRLRDRAGVSQRKAAEHHPDGISYQYWNMHEVGRVPGVEKPSTLRKMLAAITRAANLDTPLTLDDFARELARIDAGDAAEGPAPASPGRAERIAATLAPVRPERQAVFPTSAGDVVFTFPADMSPDSVRELEAYFQIFVKANLPKGGVEN